MKYWLLTWNPKKWKWDTFAPDKAKTATGQLVEEKWACVNSSAAPGDMVFLARTGDELRGIIAKGRIVGPPFDARHYDDARAANGDTAQFVPIVFDDIRDPNTDSFLPTFQLKTEVDSNQAWTPQSSGISISDATGERLLERWNALPRPSGQSDFERGSRSMLKIETPGKVEPPSDFFGDLGSKLNRFMEIYAEKKARPFGTDEELWGLMQDVERAITSSEGMRQYSHLKVDWSVGNGNWARVPWIAIMDSRITTTTQKGTYIAFLFREDLSGVYLCLTQGVTEMKRTHGSAAGLELRKHPVKTA